jgi:serine/threonine protein phosphatase PrpC
VVDAVLHAHAAVQRLAAGATSDRRPATTLTVAALTTVSGQPTFEFAHAGDSRGYVIADGVIRQVTRDHSLVEELVRAGKLNAEEAHRHPMCNVVTRVLGSRGRWMSITTQCRFSRATSYSSSATECRRISPEPTCSFWSTTLASCVMCPRRSSGAAGALVAHALGRGGSDNASAVLAQVA